MKKAFTMIELIFAIVIIGILVAIAFPKLNASRDDAKLSQLMDNISISITEMISYAIASGKIDTDYSEMSNAVSTMILSEDAVQTGDTLNIRVNNVSNCVQMKIADINHTKMLLVAYGDINGDSMCTSLQEIVGERRFPIPLLGNTIQR